MGTKMIPAHASMTAETDWGGKQGIALGASGKAQSGCFHVQFVVAVIGWITMKLTG